MSRADLEGGPVEAPPRLIEGGDRAGAGLRALEARTRPDGRDEAAAWRRLATRVRVPGGRRWFWSGTFVAAAVAVVVVIARQPSAPIASSGASSVPAPAPRVEQDVGENFEQPALRRAERHVGRAVEPPAPRVALSSRPTAIAPGRVALEDEATLDVVEGSTARASADAAWVRVLLDEGEVGLHVAKRVPGGPGFEVVAGGYHFRVLGTRFRVARNALGGPPVELWVDEGRVAVSHDGRALGVIAAGGHWDTDEEEQAAPREKPAAAERTRPARHAPTRVIAAAHPSGVAMSHASPIAAMHVSLVAAKGLALPPTCAALAEDAETARDAVTCYLAVARGADLAAQTALYEIARLRRDVLGDGAGALAALQDSRARFPAGILRDEVDVSIVELLANLNRHNEAIEEIGRLLADGHGSERNADLRVMRGNIYREVYEDFGHAERDYEAAEEARAPAVGDATFFRGVCLQALGRTAEARAAFQRYLAAGARRFADEAGRRLQRIGR